MSSLIEARLALADKLRSLAATVITGAVVEYDLANEITIADHAAICEQVVGGIWQALETDAEGMAELRQWVDASPDFQTRALKIGGFTANLRRLIEAVTLQYCYRKRAGQREMLPTMFELRSQFPKAPKDLCELITALIEQTHCIEARQSVTLNPSTLS